MELVIMASYDQEWEGAKSELREEAERLGVRRLNVNVPSSLHRDFKIKCVKEGREMSEVMMHLIYDWLRGKIDI